MICTSDRPVVLYHAVSSYQLLEVLLHRLLYNPRAKAVLILPDFIMQKYPRYKRLRRFFERVILFPYLHIPHIDEAGIFAAVERKADEMLPLPLEDFSAVYMAGAHFYFSLILIRRQVPFYFFEDAAGMYSRGTELYENLAKGYPLHAAIAQQYGLFDGSQPLIRQIICLKEAQTLPVSGDRFADFSVERALEGLSGRQRRRVVRFFLRRKIRTRAEAILLTQQLARLGCMSWEQQTDLYREYARGPLQGVRLLIKKHPDDTLDYTDIFPGAEQIRSVFPAELLPYVFVGARPSHIYTFTSTGCENLKEHFIIHRLGGKEHAGA